jgi:hypothetical protein
MIISVGGTTCNSPKIKKEMCDYFLKKLEDFYFHEGATVSADRETMGLDVHGPGWFYVSWGESIGNGKEDKDAIDPFLTLLVEVLETSCIIKCEGIFEDGSPLSSMTIEISVGAGGYRVSHFETKFTQTKKDDPLER